MSNIQDLSQQFAQIFGAYAPTDPTTPGFNPNAPDPRLRAAAALGGFDPQRTARQQREDEEYLRQDLRAKAREMAEAGRPKGKGFWNALKKGLRGATNVASVIGSGTDREGLYYKQLADDYKMKAPYISKDVLAYESAEARKAADLARRETEMLKQAAITEREMRKQREKIAADAGLKAEQAAYFAARTENMDVKTDADKLALASKAKFYKEHGVLPGEIGTAATAALELGDKPEALGNVINYGLAGAVPKAWLQSLKPGSGAGQRESTSTSTSQRLVDMGGGVQKMIPVTTSRHSLSGPVGAGGAAQQNQQAQIEAMTQRLTGQQPVDTSLVPGYKPQPLGAPSMFQRSEPIQRPAAAPSSRPSGLPKQKYSVSDSFGQTYKITEPEYENWGKVLIPPPNDGTGRNNLIINERKFYNRRDAPYKLMNAARNVKYSDLQKFAGPLANHEYATWLRNQTNMNPDSLVILDSFAARNFADITLEYSGKQVSDKERQFLEKVEATMPRDGAEQFLTKLASSMIFNAYNHWATFGNGKPPEEGGHGGLSYEYRKELGEQFQDQALTMVRKFVEAKKKGRDIDLSAFLDPDRYMAIPLARAIRKSKGIKK